MTCSKRSIKPLLVSVALVSFVAAAAFIALRSDGASNEAICTHVAGLIRKMSSPGASEFVLPDGTQTDDQLAYARACSVEITARLDKYYSDESEVATAIDHIKGIGVYHSRRAYISEHKDCILKQPSFAGLKDCHMCSTLVLTQDQEQMCNDGTIISRSNNSRYFPLGKFSKTTYSVSRSGSIREEHGVEVERHEGGVIANGTTYERVSTTFSGLSVDPVPPQLFRTHADGIYEFDLTNPSGGEQPVFASIYARGTARTIHGEHEDVNFRIFPELRTVKGPTHTYRDCLGVVIDTSTQLMSGNTMRSHDELYLAIDIGMVHETIDTTVEHHSDTKPDFSVRTEKWLRDIEP